MRLAERPDGLLEPIAGHDGRADGQREQHRHSLGLALVPGGHQLLGIIEDLAIGRMARSRFLLGLLPAGVLRPALVEAHSGNIIRPNKDVLPLCVGGVVMLGSYTRVFDDDDVLKLLHSSVKSAGGQSAFARQTGVDRAVLNHVLTGKRLPTSSILKALNLGIVYVALGQSAGLAIRKLPPRRRHG